MYYIRSMIVKSFQQSLNTPHQGGIRWVLGYAQLLRRVEKLLANHLPENIKDHYRVVQFRNNILVIQVDSAVWATRLRFLVPTLKRQWQQQTTVNTSFPSIQQIDIKVQLPQSINNPPLSRKPLPISEQTATLLEQTAAQMPQSTLKETLLRLAAHRTAQHEEDTSGNLR